MAFSAKAREARPRPRIYQGSCGEGTNSGGIVDVGAMLKVNLKAVNESIPDASVLSGR